jgi:hypothetical protein
LIWLWEYFSLSGILDLLGKQKSRIHVKTTCKQELKKCNEI